MRVLVTSSRNPFALDIIRKLGSTGHTVVRQRYVPGRDRQPLQVRRRPRHDRLAAVRHRSLHRRRRAMSSRASRIDLILPTLRGGVLPGRSRPRSAAAACASTPAGSTSSPGCTTRSASSASPNRPGYRSRRRSWRPTTPRWPPPSPVSRSTSRVPRSRAAASSLLTNTGPLAGQLSVERRPPHAGPAVAGAALRRRADGVHLQHGRGRTRHRTLHLPGAGAVGAQHRHRVPRRRQRTDARGHPASRGRPRRHLHRAVVLRLGRPRRASCSASNAIRARRTGSSCSAPRNCLRD